MEFSSNDADIWARIRELRAANGNPDGTCKKLKCYHRNEVDLFAWVEPRDAIWSLSGERDIRIYVACVNIGYHSVSVTHSVTTRHGAVRLEDDVDIYKDQEVDEANFGFLNWHYKRVLLETADARDDLVVKWLVSGIRGNESYRGLVKVKTL